MGTSLAEKEGDLALRKIKSLLWLVASLSIGFFVFFVGILFKISELTKIPLSNPLLGGGLFLVLLTLLFERVQSNGIR